MMLHPDHATIELRRCYVPNCIVPHDPQPMISVCTVTVEELSRRTLMGEEEWDVIEEYTSWIWFFDRDGFRAASHLARRILWSGEVLYGVSAREPTPCGIDGEPGKLVVSLSAHHTEGGQRKAPSATRRNCRCAVEEAGDSPASVQPALPPEKRNFFDDPETVARFRELRARQRHDRFERSQEVLRIIQEVQLAGSFAPGDEAFNALAQRLSVLIFGE